MKSFRSVVKDLQEFRIFKRKAIVELLFYTDYYDGPLQGACLYDGKIRWFIIQSSGGWVGNYFDDDQAIYVPRTYTVKAIGFWQLVSELLDYYVLWPTAYSYPQGLFGKRFLEHRFLEKEKDLRLKTVGAFSANELRW